MKNSDTKYWVYILECSDGTYYTGITTDVQQRVETHNIGRGAKYTASRRPVRLVYSESQPGRAEATRREMEIKGLKRSMKEALIKDK